MCIRGLTLLSTGTNRIGFFLATIFLGGCGLAPKEKLPPASEQKDIYQLSALRRIRWDLDAPDYYQSIVQEYMDAKVPMLQGFGLHDVFTNDDSMEQVRQLNITAFFNTLASLPPSYRQRLYLFGQGGFRIIRQSSKVGEGNAATAYAKRDPITKEPNWNLGPDLVRIRGVVGNIQFALLHELGHIFHFDWMARGYKIDAMPINDYLKSALSQLGNDQYAVKYVRELMLPDSVSGYTELLAEGFASYYGSPSSHEDFRNPARESESWRLMKHPLHRVYLQLSVLFDAPPVWESLGIKVKDRPSDDKTPVRVGPGVRTFTTGDYVPANVPFCAFSADGIPDVAKYNLISKIILKGQKSRACKETTWIFNCDGPRCAKEAGISGNNVGHYLLLQPRGFDFYHMQPNSTPNTQPTHTVIKYALKSLASEDKSLPEEPAPVPSAAPLTAPPVGPQNTPPHSTSNTQKPQ